MTAAAPVPGPTPGPASAAPAPGTPPARGHLDRTDRHDSHDPIIPPSGPTAWLTTLTASAMASPAVSAPAPVRTASFRRIQIAGAGL